MATGKAHQITGVASSIFIGIAVYRLGFIPHEQTALVGAIAGGAIGARAPDWMEAGVLTHRTVTHWWLLWLLIPFVTWLAIRGQAGAGAEIILSGTIGMAIAALTHLLFDLPNPMGVPFLSPWRRISLNWWRSGQHEWLLVPVWLVLTLWPAWLLSG